MATKPKTADEDLVVAPDPETEAASVAAEVAAEAELVVPGCEYIVTDDFTATVDWSTVTFKKGTKLDPVAGARLAAMAAPVATVED